MWCVKDLWHRGFPHLTFSCLGCEIPQSSKIVCSLKTHGMQALLQAGFYGSQTTCSSSNDSHFLTCAAHFTCLVLTIVRSCVNLEQKYLTSSHWWPTCRVCLSSAAHFVPQKDTNLKWHTPSQSSNFPRCVKGPPPRTPLPSLDLTTKKNIQFAERNQSGAIQEKQWKQEILSQMAGKCPLTETRDSSLSGKNPLYMISSALIKSKWIVFLHWLILLSPW